MHVATSEAGYNHTVTECVWGYAEDVRGMGHSGHARALTRNAHITCGIRGVARHHHEAQLLAVVTAAAPCTCTVAGDSASHGLVATLRWACVIGGGRALLHVQGKDMTK